MTHEAEVAAYAERIITFRDGRVVADKRSGAKSVAAPVGPAHCASSQMSMTLP